MTERNRRRLSLFLTVSFVAALLMGPGPGMLLINQPRSFLGIPQLYAWGLLWYAVEVGIVVAAYCFVWNSGPVADEIRIAQRPPATARPSDHDHPAAESDPTRD